MVGTGAKCKPYRRVSATLIAKLSPATKIRRGASYVIGFFGGGVDRFCYSNENSFHGPRDLRVVCYSLAYVYECYVNLDAVRFELLMQESICFAHSASYEYTVYGVFESFFWYGD
jgi:hypothetical protein